MTNKIKRIGSMIILAVITVGWFIGCSFSTPIFTKHSEKRTLILEKPPVRIIMTGEFDELNNNNIIEIINALNGVTYYNYNFDDTYNIGTDIGLKHEYLLKYDSKIKK